MMNKTKKILCAILAFVLVLSVIPALPASAATLQVEQVGALWDGFTAGSGTFTVTADSRLFVVSANKPSGDLLQTAQLLQRQLQDDFSGSFTKLVYGEISQAKAGDIVLVLDTASGTGADGYKLNVTATTATVTAADVDGLIYGTNNLMKCFRAVGGKSISCFSGNDSPDTKERTVSLDCGRKYLTPEWIKNFIRQMSWMGYNTLQLHFSDDGGFRVDLWDPAYFTSKNGNDFSWLAGSHIQTWVHDAKNTNGQNYRNDKDANKYLTAAQLVDICNVAKEYHIEIIPSFDSPSHMDYITWRYEQYANSTGFSFKQNNTVYTADFYNNYCINYTGKTARSLGADPDAGPTNWPCYTTIDITDGTVAKAFVFALYEDIADFFKQYAGSKNFSIGADEVNLTSYTSSYPRKWSASAFPGYINDLNDLLKNKGYTMRMYNDFMGSSSFSLSQFDSDIEIMYWNAPNKTDDVVRFVNNNRKIYNCIQSHTYYVLRVANTNVTYKDARHPGNRQWTFFRSTEQDIYEEWVPNNVSEIGINNYKQSTISANNLGGAYFLIWNDYPTVSTEQEIWEGAPDTSGTSNEVYYLLDRMASNIIKMWNWDVNSSVSYSQFAKVRDAVNEDFPGFTSCSKAAALPAASAPEKAQAADHSALEAALATKLPAADYTPSTYAAYEAAYASAQTVNSNDEATQEDVDAALAALNAAIQGLAKCADLTALKAAIDNAPTAEINYTVSSWAALVAALDAANDVIDDAEAVQADADAALAALNAAIEALVDISELQGAVSGTLTEQGDYTDDTWAAYQSALAAAEVVLDDEDATKDEVEKALTELNAARNALTKENTSGIEIINIRKASKYSNLGKKATLTIITSADAETLEILRNGQLVNLSTCTSNIQTISGQQVRVWYVKFVTTDKGDAVNYTVRVDSAVEQTIAITVK